MFCKNCGHQVDDHAAFCPNCGCRTDNPGSDSTGAGSNGNVNTAFTGSVSKYSRGLAMIFVVLLGWIGVHRFYVGKVGTGVLWLLTGGCLGIGVLVDLIMIACGSFTDASGNVLSNWEIK